VKVVQEDRNVVRNSVIKKTACGIQLNAHSFQILSRLYSDPVLAILRELGTNAAESHARADCLDVQWVVKLPNTLNPTFSVRDYGTGMSEDVIHNVYANYMASDKRDTNKEGGYFGLGSKTPFCYTDSFNVVCYENGTCRRYVMARNEQGCPELNEFPPCDTEEPDGVEISFTVKEKDFKKFRDKAEQAYRFFRFPPRVVGNTDFKISKPDYLVKDPNSKFDGVTISSQSYVIMGDIGYSLDEFQFSHGTSTRTLLASGAVLEVAMGSLELVPSREGLEYTEHTIKSIETKCEEFLAVLNELVDREFDDCTSFWHASLLYQKLQAKFGSVSQHIQCLSDKNFQEQVLREKMVLPFSVRRVVGKYLWRNGMTVKRPKETNTVVIKEDVILFFEDCRGAYGRVRQHLRATTTDDVNAYLINEDNIDEFLERSGLQLEDLTKTSSLPKVERKYNGGGGPRKPRSYENVLEFDPNATFPGNRLPGSRYWSDTQSVDIHNGTFVYCQFYRNDITDHGVNVGLLSSILRAANSLGISYPKIYGVRKTNKVEKLPNWQPIKMLLQSLLETMHTRYDIHTLKKLNSNGDLIRTVQSIIDYTDFTFADDHPLSELLKLAETDHSRIISMVDKLSKFGTMKACKKQVSDLSVLDTVNHKYRFLHHVRAYDIYNATAADAMVVAIQAIDQTLTT
jgi:hypothetical protein